jgi:hypothetical protein
MGGTAEEIRRREESDGRTVRAEPLRCGEGSKRAEATVTPRCRRKLRASEKGSYLRKTEPIFFMYSIRCGSMAKT